MKPTRHQTTQFLMSAREEDRRDTGQGHGGANRADEKERLAADAVDKAHRKHGEEQVGGAHRHGLQIA